MRTKILLLFLILLSINAFAVVDRIIDPEIPIDDNLVDFEENFDDLLISIVMVVSLSIASVVGTIFVFLGIMFIANKFRG